jgi:hypothetical protein
MHESHARPGFMKRFMWLLGAWEDGMLIVPSFNSELIEKPMSEYP